VIVERTAVGAIDGILVGDSGYALQIVSYDTSPQAKE